MSDLLLGLILVLAAALVRLTLTPREEFRPTFVIYKSVVVLIAWGYAIRTALQWHDGQAAGLFLAASVIAAVLLSLPHFIIIKGPKGPPRDDT